MTVAHIPARPTWSCTGCAEPWPCAAKREQLVAEYTDSPAALRTMMALRVADAAEDLREFGADQLWTRFLGWLPAPGQGPVIRWVANPPLGGHRRPVGKAQPAAGSAQSTTGKTQPATGKAQPTGKASPPPAKTQGRAQAAMSALIPDRSRPATDGGAMRTPPRRWPAHGSP